jgi:hypothetical protein
MDYFSNRLPDEVFKIILSFLNTGPPYRRYSVRSLRRVSHAIREQVLRADAAPLHIFYPIGRSLPLHLPPHANRMTLACYNAITQSSSREPVFFDRQVRLPQILRLYVEMQGIKMLTDLNLRTFPNLQNLSIQYATFKVLKLQQGMVYLQLATSPFLTKIWNVPKSLKIVYLYGIPNLRTLPDFTHVQFLTLVNMHPFARIRCNGRVRAVSRPLKFPSPAGIRECIFVDAGRYEHVTLAFINGVFNRALSRCHINTQNLEVRLGRNRYPLRMFFDPNLTPPSFT